MFWLLTNNSHLADALCENYAELDLFIVDYLRHTMLVVVKKAPRNQDQAS